MEFKGSGTHRSWASGRLGFVPTGSIQLQVRVTHGPALSQGPIGPKGGTWVVPPWLTQHRRAGLETRVDRVEPIPPVLVLKPGLYLLRPQLVEVPRPLPWDQPLAHLSSGELR